MRLKYDSVIDSAFSRVKELTDRVLGEKSPAAARALAAAYSRVRSDDPEEVAQAMNSCRRALKAVADLVMPAGSATPDGHVLNDSAYLNRLTQFVKQSVQSDRERAMLLADLGSFSKYIAAVNGLASKGVHATIAEADSVVVHTYLVIGQLLSVSNAQSLPIISEFVAETGGPLAVAARESEPPLSIVGDDMNLTESKPNRHSRRRQPAD